MSNDNKTNLKPRHGQPSTSQPHKRGSLLSFIIFMVWVAGIGLLLSLIACQPNQPVISIIGISSL
ncbi:hypothetical protein [Psychrobacter sp. UBA3068]|uniref:hypothetical protein n=1 Tax=Psychrobacter sp. UBA3068 TaxID=1947349 RepID=UPI00257FA262|nr:hypothetical protein [Psychrobacter sp. UBA3068]